MSEKMAELYISDAIKDFGGALRKALRNEKTQDYASLMELEYAETPEGFFEAIRKFLRRFESYASKEHWKRPTEESLEEIANLVDLHGVQKVRAALVSHALVKREREE